MFALRRIGRERSWCWHLAAASGWGQTDEREFTHIEEMLNVLEPSPESGRLDAQRSEEVVS